MCRVVRGEELIQCSGKKQMANGHFHEKIMLWPTAVADTVFSVICVLC